MTSSGEQYSIKDSLGKYGFKFYPCKEGDVNVKIATRPKPYIVNKENTFNFKQLASAVQFIKEAKLCLRSAFSKMELKP